MCHYPFIDACCSAVGHMWVSTTFLMSKRQFSSLCHHTSLRIQRWALVFFYCESESSSASLIVCNKICDCMCTEQQAETCFLPINSENICLLRRSGKRKAHHQYCRVLHDMYSIAWYCMAGYQKVIPHFLVPCCMVNFTVFHLFYPRTIISIVTHLPCMCCCWLDNKWQ